MAVGMGMAAAAAVEDAAAAAVEVGGVVGHTGAGITQGNWTGIG